MGLATITYTIDWNRNMDQAMINRVRIGKVVSVVRGARLVG
jgi:hypothetical protein